MTIRSDPHEATRAAIAEIWRMIADLNDRIARQQKRIDKIKVVGSGPADQMQALLEEMMISRGMMDVQLADLEADLVQESR